MSCVTRLVLELDRKEPQISGRLRAGGAQARRFDGWLGLISALDAELARLGTCAATAPPSANRGGGGGGG